jgi:hypothetical protein
MNRAERDRNLVVVAAVPGGFPGTGADAAGTAAATESFDK